MDTVTMSYDHFSLLSKKDFAKCAKLMGCLNVSGNIRKFKF